MSPSGFQCRPVVSSVAQWYPVSPSGFQCHPVASSVAQWSPVTSSGFQWHPVAPSGLSSQSLSKWSGRRVEVLRHNAVNWEYESIDLHVCDPRGLSWVLPTYTSYRCDNLGGHYIIAIANHATEVRAMDVVFSALVAVSSRMVGHRTILWGAKYYELVLTM